MTYITMPQNEFERDYVKREELIGAQEIILRKSKALDLMWSALDVLSPEDDGNTCMRRP